MNLAQAIANDKYALPQYPIYKPTLKEDWITVRTVVKRPDPESIRGEKHGVRTKLLEHLTETPKHGIDIIKLAIDVTRNQGFSTLNHMAHEGLIQRVRGVRSWMYFTFPKEPTTVQEPT